MSTRRAEIGRRIRNLRREQNMSQEHLGKVCNLPRHAVLDIEHGRRSVMLDEAVTISIYLGVSLDYLAGVTNGYRKVGS